MFSVIYDCDNTLGVLRSDVDDGLTFAYLHAHPDIRLLGLTCTFGNNAEHIVYANTVQMMEDLGIGDLPVFRGGRTPGAYESEAVDFLVESVRKAPGEITVIATGALTNLAGAYAKDPDFFRNLRQLIVMGGMLEPLHLNGVPIAELNFSADFKASTTVLSHCPRLTILSAQCTQDAVYGEQEVQQLLAQNTRFMRLYADAIRNWIRFIAPAYGNRSVFINWDLCCAIYLTRPELFEQKLRRITVREEELRTGHLPETDSGTDWVSIQIPEKIVDLEEFNREFLKIMALL